MNPHSYHHQSAVTLAVAAGLASVGLASALRASVTRRAHRPPGKPTKNGIPIVQNKPILWYYHAGELVTRNVPERRISESLQKPNFIVQKPVY